MNEDNFPVLFSRHSSGLTYFIKGFGWFFSFFIFLCSIFTGILLFTENSFPYGIEIVLMALCLLLLLLFGWLIISSLIKGQDDSITHLTVDKYGIHYYTETKCNKALLYDELNSSPESGGYDVFLNDLVEGGPYYIYFYTGDSSGKPKIGSLDFNTKTVITNGNKIYRHFVKGIQLFRPDLTIAPGVLNLYRIEEI